MFQAKHCDLYEFPKRNLKIGLHCNFTDKKPNFKGACFKIKFNRKICNQTMNALIVCYCFYF